MFSASYWMKKQATFSRLKIHENEMKMSEKETYLGNVLTTDEKLTSPTSTVWVLRTKPNPKSTTKLLQVQ